MTLSGKSSLILWENEAAFPERVTVTMGDRHGRSEPSQRVTWAIPRVSLCKDLLIRKFRFTEGVLSMCIYCNAKELQRHQYWISHTGTSKPIKHGVKEVALLGMRKSM